MWLKVLLAGSAMVLACLSPTHATSVALVKARLESVQQGGLSGRQEGINFSVTFRLTFRVSSVLVGVYHGGRVVTTVEQDSRPKEGTTYFLLLSVSDGGHRIVWLGPESYGLCVDKAQVRSYGIGDEIGELLRRYPCR